MSLPFALRSRPAPLPIPAPSRPAVDPEALAWWESQRPEGQYIGGDGRPHPFSEGHLDVDLVGVRLISDETIARWRLDYAAEWRDLASWACCCGCGTTQAECLYASGCTLPTGGHNE